MTLQRKHVVLTFDLLKETWEFKTWQTQFKFNYPDDLEGPNDRIPNQLLRPLGTLHQGFLVRTLPENIIMYPTTAHR
jgi:hypothetical protein